MASSRNLSNGLKIAVIMMLICSLSSISVESVGLRGGEIIWKQRKPMLGSRPPRCLNRCLSCRPCMAALVIPSHRKKGFNVSSQGDETYYLLSWKCRCGDKLFPP